MLYRLSYRGLIIQPLSERTCLLYTSFHCSSSITDQISGTVISGIHVPSKLHTDFIRFLFFFSLNLPGQALDLLVTVSSMHYCTSTPALSTSSSSRGLTLTMGYLILRGASRLDAFSVYPVPAWLLCHGLGKPTDPPAASPSRSSRTKDSSSQISCAHAG